MCGVGWVGVGAHGAATPASILRFISDQINSIDNYGWGVWSVVG